jgi:hypothetical protein
MRDHVNRLHRPVAVLAPAGQHGCHVPVGPAGALEGIRFPLGLMMFRKMLFTLDGILHDIGAPGLRMDLVLARYMLARSPLSLIDWIGVQSSAAALWWRDCGCNGLKPR